MKRKQVWRYYCEHCHKSGCSAAWIARHEASCTLNPHRYCRMCDLFDREQVDIEAIVATLPALPEDDIEQFLQAQLPALRERVSNCPVCILAAVRQAGWSTALLQMYELFDCTRECKSAFAELGKRDLMAVLP